MICLPGRLPEPEYLLQVQTAILVGELIPELIARGYKVRLMVRKNKAEYQQRWPSSEIVVADVLDYQSLEPVLKDIDCAYYLIHSLYSTEDFKEIDKKSSYQFQKGF